MRRSDGWGGRSLRTRRGWRCERCGGRSGSGGGCDDGGSVLVVMAVVLV